MFQPCWASSNDLFGFLTTEPNAEVKAIHPKAMPVILTTPAEVDTWLPAATMDALALPRPLPGGAVKIVARGDRTATRRGSCRNLILTKDRPTRSRPGCSIRQRSRGT